eukprot:764638-Hanusia_phi.AAC.1
MAVQFSQIQQAIHEFMTEFSDVLADDRPVDYNVSRDFDLSIQQQNLSVSIRIRSSPRVPLFLEKDPSSYRMCLDIRKLNDMVNRILLGYLPQEISQVISDKPIVI